MKFRVEQFVKIAGAASGEWLPSLAHSKEYSNSEADRIVNNSGPHLTYRAVAVDPPVYVGKGKGEEMKDLKAALSSSVKPDITHVRTPLLNYTARNCEYGNDKYERANYIRPTQPGLSNDFQRYRAYLRAAVSHAYKVLDSMERHQAMDPKLEDEAGMRTACYAVDMDPDTSGKVGPSKLSHIGGTCASLNMALEQAVTAGLLPEDPGTPWKTNGPK